MQYSTRGGRILLTINMVVGIIVVVLGVALVVVLSALASSQRDAKHAIRLLGQESARTECSREVTSDYTSAMWSDVASVLFFSRSETRDSAQVVDHISAMVNRQPIDVQVNARCAAPIADAVPTATCAVGRGVTSTTC